MATLETATRNAACNAIADLVDAGDDAGYIQFETSGDAEVATCTMSDPAFGDAAAGVATANAISDDTDATGGVIAQASLYDSDDTKILEATCGTGAEEFQFGSTESMTLGAGDQLSVDSLTLTVPAS